MDLKDQDLRRGDEIEAAVSTNHGNIFPGFAYTIIDIRTIKDKLSALLYNKELNICVPYTPVENIVAKKGTLRRRSRSRSRSRSSGNLDDLFSKLWSTRGGRKKTRTKNKKIHQKRRSSKNIRSTKRRRPTKRM